MGEPQAWESERRNRRGTAWECGRSLAGELSEMENLRALIGLSRHISLHRDLEVVANNIANLDTTASSRTARCSTNS